MAPLILSDPLSPSFGRHFSPTTSPQNRNHKPSTRPSFLDWRPNRLVNLHPDPLSSAFLHFQFPPDDLSTVDASTHTLLKRQNNVIGIIPTGYSNQNDSPLPGTVAGIVLGTVAGVIFIAYLIYILATRNQRSTLVVEEVDISDRESSRSRSRRRSKNRRSSHRRAREESLVEKSLASRSEAGVTAAQPPPGPASDFQPPKQPEVIREYHERVEVRERPRRSPTPPSLQDEIIVIEESETVSDVPKRKKSSRKTTERTVERERTREDDRRRSSVRYVNPNEFGGGPVNDDGYDRRGSRRDY